jgi:5'-deoxynucleotidase YfbR-like HD superfamily hydrolase
MSVPRDAVRDREVDREDLGRRLDLACREYMAQVGDNRTLASRMSGEVMRYHAWRTNFPQSGADHQWHVARIHVQVFGVPNEYVLAFLLYHDVGELLASDIQFPLKRYAPELKVITDDAESVMSNKLGLDFSPTMMPDDRWRFKACDLLEMYEYGTRELMHGNVNTGSVVRRRIREALEAHCTNHQDQSDRTAVAHHIAEVDKWLTIS